MSELKKLSKRHSIYVYCRGRYCLIAFEGVKKLRSAGVPARRLVFSVPEWRAAKDRMVGSEAVRGLHIHGGPSSIDPEH